MDIAISGTIALLTVVLTYLGVHVTLHPVAEQEAQKKNAFKVAFAACGIVMCALITWQGVRNKHSQDALNAALARIEGNTLTPPKVDVHVPPAQIVIPPAVKDSRSLASIRQFSSGPCSPNIVGNGNTQNCNTVPHYPSLNTAQQTTIAELVEPLAPRTVFVFTLQNGASYETVVFADQLGSALSQHMHVGKMPMLATAELPPPGISVFLSPKDQDLLDALNRGLKADHVIKKDIAFKYGPPDNTQFQIMIAEPGR